MTHPQDKNKIVGFSREDISLITNGNADSIKNISNPNQIGQVKNANDEIISDITPLIMVINAAGTGDIWKQKVYSLISVGADPNMTVNYYNRNTTAKEIGFNYRNLDI